jgi:hypothetical protein
MDKFFSICAFPIGLSLCFFPALIVWVRELRKRSNEDRDKRD